MFFAVRFTDNWRIFIGGVAGEILRNLHDGPTTWLHDPEKFWHALNGVLDVLHDMVAKNDIETVVFERNLVEVKVEVSDWWN